MKICKKCRVCKEFDEFPRNKNTWDGHASQCKLCLKEYYQKNKDRILRRSAEYKLENSTYLRIKQSQHRKKNSMRYGVYMAEYRAARRNARPPWLTEEHRTQILAVYLEARRLSRSTGVKYHVDHIVPLKGETVCGLHVPWNLRAIPAEENMKKGNRLLDK